MSQGATYCSEGVGELMSCHAEDATVFRGGARATVCLVTLKMQHSVQRGWRG